MLVSNLIIVKNGWDNRHYNFSKQDNCWYKNTICADHHIVVHVTVVVHNRSILAMQKCADYVIFANVGLDPGLYMCTSESRMFYNEF